MKMRLLFPAVLALAVVSCSSDEGPVTGVAKDVGIAAAPRSNPPPPALAGALWSSFTQGGSVNAAAPEVSLEVGGTLLRSEFWLPEAEYNAVQNLSSYWINLPAQTLPAKAWRIGSISKGRIAWAQSSGMTTGSGRIFSFNQSKKLFVVIDLTQIQYQGNGFESCFRPQRSCVTITPAVTAQFYKIVGTDRKGDYLFNVTNTDPAQVSWVEKGQW